MHILCFFGRHAWEGCKCSRCGLTRDEGHDWDGCICRRCGLKRDQDHSVEGCVCVKCGAEFHDFEVLDKEDYEPSCCYSAGDPCTGPDCGTWCDSNPGPAYHYELVRCRRCGKKEEHGEMSPWRKHQIEQKERGTSY